VELLNPSQPLQPPIDTGHAAEGKRSACQAIPPNPGDEVSQPKKWGIPGKGVSDMINPEVKQSSRSATSLQREGVDPSEIKRRPVTAQVGSRTVPEVCLQYQSALIRTEG
jgi:hypothetical protein